MNTTKESNLGNQHLPPDPAHSLRGGLGVIIASLFLQARNRRVISPPSHVARAQKVTHLLDSHALLFHLPIQVHMASFHEG